MITKIWDKELEKTRLFKVLYSSDCDQYLFDEHRFCKKTESFENYQPVPEEQAIHEEISTLFNNFQKNNINPKKGLENLNLTFQEILYGEIKLNKHPDFKTKESFKEILNIEEVTKINEYALTKIHKN